MRIMEVEVEVWSTGIRVQSSRESIDTYNKAETREPTEYVLAAISMAAVCPHPPFGWTRWGPRPYLQ